MSLSSTYLNLKNLIATNLTSKGVSASKNDGLTTLANAILDIEQGGGGPEIVSFDNLTTEFNYTRKRGSNGFGVAVPSGVTNLGDYCFHNCTGLTSVTIPSGVTSLGKYCFYNCTGLTSVTIPSGVTSLGGYCFQNCSGLTSVTIPSSVTNIGINCFQNCSGLTSVTILSSVTSIGNNCFNGCTGLTSIVIPSSVTSLGHYCFNECTGLTSITIPGSVTSLGEACFQGCTGLTSVVIPSSVTSLGNYCFRYCTNLVDYQLYWETPPVTWYSALMPNNADTYYTIPNGTTANYTAKGFPSNKLVEAIFTDCGVTNNSNLIQWYYNPSYSSASVDESGTTFIPVREGSYATVSATLTQNPSSTDIYPYSFPLTVEFDLIEREDNQGATNDYARIRVYNSANNKIAYWNFTDFGVGHYKIVCTEGSQKLYYNDVEQSRKFTFTPTNNWNVAFQTKGSIKFKNFRIYHMPWESHIQLTATNPYLMSGETTDVVVELENGLGNPLTNRNVTIEQSVFIDDGTTASHNDNWSTINSSASLTRLNDYTELKRTENASTFAWINKNLSVTDGITIEFDLKQATPSSSNKTYLTFRATGGSVKLGISKNYANLADGQWHHYKFDVNGLTVTPTIDGVQRDNLSLSGNFITVQLDASEEAVHHFKNFKVYEIINGVTDENGEFALNDVSVTDDTYFTATYGTVSDSCLVEYCDFVDYAVTNNKNNTWFNNTGGTITVDDSGTTFTAVPHSNGTHWTCGYCPGSTTSRSPFNYPIIVEFDILHWTDKASIFIKSDLGNRTSFSSQLNHIGSRARIEIGTTSTKIYIDGAFVSEKTYTQPSSYGIELGTYTSKNDVPTAPSLKFANLTIRPL